jgi:hypothetical protein
VCLIEYTPVVGLVMVDQELGLLVLLTLHHQIFLWGTLKGIVYQDVSTTLESMWHCIIDECAALNPQIIE